MGFANAERWTEKLGVKHALLGHCFVLRSV